MSRYAYIYLCTLLSVAGCCTDRYSKQVHSSNAGNELVDDGQQVAIRRAVDALSRNPASFVAEELSKTNYVVNAYKTNKGYTLVFIMTKVPDASITVEVTPKDVQVMHGGWFHDP